MTVRMLLATAVIVALAAVPARAGTIRMSGQQITGAVVADLAYFYRHDTRRPPRFEISGGGTGPGLADLSRG